VEEPEPQLSNEIFPGPAQKNNIGPDGASELAMALASNSTLKAVNIEVPALIDARQRGGYR